MRPSRPKEEQILVWCGVVAQLQRTRSNAILGDAEIPYPLFVLLRHFCHDPDREWTVSSLAHAFQTHQPGITKTVKKLVERKLLRMRADPHDARIKKLRVTASGIRMRDKAIALLGPDTVGDFAGWKRSEIAELHRMLERLKNDLDEARN